MKKKFLTYLLALVLSPAAMSQSAITLTVTDINNTVVAQKINAGASALLTELNKAYAENRTPALNNIVGLSKDGRNSILSMWEMAQFRCTESKITERGFGMPAGWQVRNIKVFLKDMPKDEANKEIAINFDKFGNIEDIYFALEYNVYQEIMNSEGNDVTDLRRRQAILNFVENFRTAYNRKDIGLLDKVFSEDALIITGKVVKQAKTTDNMMANSGFPKEKIEYQVKTKKEYISALRGVFARNDRINVVFDNIEVSQHPKYDDIYGVTLKQGWNTTTYSDVGWLFLMIDFRDGENMMIHVRTWQPEKINGNPLPEDEKITLGDFKIGKSN